MEKRYFIRVFYHPDCFYGINELVFKWIDQSIKDKVQPLIGEEVLKAKEKISKLDSRLMINNRINNVFSYILKNK